MPRWRLKCQKKTHRFHFSLATNGSEDGYNIHGYFNRENDDHPVDVRFTNPFGPAFSATPTLRAPHVYHVDLSADPNKQILIVITHW